MTTYSNLNENELNVLKAISISSDENGGDFTEFQDVLNLVKNLNESQLKGYISQLSQKKYISVETNSKNPVIFSGDFVDFLTEYKFN